MTDSEVLDCRDQDALNLMLIIILKVVFAVAFAAGLVLFAMHAKAGADEWAGPAALLVFLAPLFLFFGKDVVRLWDWLYARARRHAYRTEERVYRYGYVPVRMLMTGQIPWFSAADVGRALGLPKIGDEARKLDVLEWEEMGRRKGLYLSETAVLTLIDRAPGANRREFKIWFTREVMSPLNRERERVQEERKAKRNDASQMKRPR